MRATCVLQDGLRSCAQRPGNCNCHVSRSSSQRCASGTKGLHGDLAGDCARHDNHAHVVGVLGRNLKCIPARGLTLHLDCPTAVLQLGCQGPLLAAAAVTAAAWEGGDALELDWVLPGSLGFLFWCADSN